MGTPLRPESRESPLWLASATSISSNVLVAVGFHRTAWRINHEGVPRGDLLQGSLQGPLPEDIFDGEGEMGPWPAPPGERRPSGAAPAMSTRFLQRGPVLACAVRCSRLPRVALPDWTFANPDFPLLQQCQA